MTRAHKILEILSNYKAKDSKEYEVLPYTWMKTIYIGDIEYSFIAAIDDTEKEELTVAFTRQGRYHAWLASFRSAQDIQTQTRELLQALPQLQQFIYSVYSHNRDKISSITFSAENRELNRIRLYDRIADRIANQFHGRVEKSKDSAFHTYRIYLPYG